MITYTNKLNLPQQVINMMKRNTYDSGDSAFSVTQLIDSPRIVQLKARHDYEMDYASLWASFVGDLLHAALETGEKEGLREQRLYAQIHGVIVSGQLDRYYIGSDILLDYKTGGEASLFKFAKPSWERQLNCYAALARRYGLTPKVLQVLRFAVDWRDDWTGGTPTDLIEIPMWGDIAAEFYLEDRVDLHRAAEKCTDEELPLCTAEEMWEKPKTYAVMRKGVRRAQRVLDSYVACEDWMLEHDLDLNDKKYSIEERPGERTRCERFCICKDKCSQYKEYKDANS